MKNIFETNAEKLYHAANSLFSDDEDAPDGEHFGNSSNSLVMFSMAHHSFEPAEIANRMYLVTTIIERMTDFVLEVMYVTRHEDTVRVILSLDHVNSQPFLTEERSKLLHGLMKTLDVDIITLDNINVYVGEQ
jgi:hypothetical protein